MVALARVTDREKLKPRRDPYWTRIAAGAYLGFRKMRADSVGSWAARWRDPATGKQSWHPLGEFEHLPPSERYDAAAKAAAEWLSHFTQVGRTDVITVADACDAYIRRLRKQRGDVAASEAEQRLKRLVLAASKLADLPLAKLTKAHMKAWRAKVEDAPLQQGGRVPHRQGELGQMKLTAATREKLQRKRSAATINRDLAVFRAVLNQALTEGHVVSAVAWQSALTPIKNATRRRRVYLDRKQREKLIEAAPPDLALFIRGMAALPLRPGALAALTVGDFDRRLNTLAVGKDKAGAGRSIKMPPSVVALLMEASRNKLPTAPLFARATGEAWGKDAWVPAFKAAAAAAGLPHDATMYSLRHAVITDLATDGVDLSTIAQLSGTSIAMIQAHYAHLQQDVAAAALERLSL